MPHHADIRVNVIGTPDRSGEGPDAAIEIPLRLCTVPPLRRPPERVRLMGQAGQMPAMEGAVPSVCPAGSMLQQKGGRPNPAYGGEAELTNSLN